MGTGVPLWPANKCTTSKLCPSTPETVGDNEGDFSRVRCCAASRILVSVASFFEAPRRVMIVWCALVMKEVRVHQRRKLKCTHLQPLLRSEYHSFGRSALARTTLSSVREHRECSHASFRSSMDVVAGPGVNLGAPLIRAGEFYDVAVEVSSGIKSSSMRNRQRAVGDCDLCEMKRSFVAKPVKSGEGWSLVGLREYELTALFNHPAVPSSLSSWLGTGKFAFAQDECLWLWCHAKEAWAFHRMPRLPGK